MSWSPPGLLERPEGRGQCPGPWDRLLLREAQSVTARRHSRAAWGWSSLATVREGTPGISGRAVAV